jgi:hypothetical protein
MHKCVTTQIDSSLPDLFTSSWSPSHIDLCRLKVSVLAPLQWGHQTFSCFGFPTYPRSSRMCSPLVRWLNSNNVAVFVLDLKSTHEGEHMIFGLLSLAKHTQNDILQFHPSKIYSLQKVIQSYWGLQVFTDLGESGTMEGLGLGLGLLVSERWKTS